MGAAWLPLCLSFSNPSFCSAFNASAPEMRGNLGMCGNSECRDHRVPAGDVREFFEVQGRRLFEIRDGLFDSIALGRGPRLRVEGDETAFFCGRQYGSELHGGLRSMAIMRLRELSCDAVLWPHRIQSQRCCWSMLHSDRDAYQILPHGIG